MTDRASLELSRRKVRDRSMMLVLIGSAMLMPPLIGVSLVEGTVAGIPVPLIYVFAVWSALIAGSAALARPLRESDEAATSAEPNDPDP